MTSPNEKVNNPIVPVITDCEKSELKLKDTSPNDTVNNHQVIDKPTSAINDKSKVIILKIMLK